ncbi:MAG: fumarate hydratase C-terminal domain-containing protein, partial [Candidatus Thermoplasmatota archaeon]|nr:fumarate hydratase C-terminal domain-containing protein [Candidatus Thermoplasmatota archaeon]
PTTSSRLELFEADFLRKYPSINIIIGKGGMGEKTLVALRNHGVYLSFTGGAAALAADQISKVEDVFWLNELGMAEAVWIFFVNDFGPLIVGMDSHGKSLFEKKL